MYHFRFIQFLAQQPTDFNLGGQLIWSLSAKTSGLHGESSFGSTCLMLPEHVYMVLCPTGTLEYAAMEANW